MTLPKVLIVGAGGIGTINALALDLNGKADATLVVRSDYNLVKEKGYEINSSMYGNFHNWRPNHFVPSIDVAAKEHGPFDFIMVTTKNIPDGPSSCESIIESAVTPGFTTIVLMQNGIDIEVPMKKAFPNNVVLSGVIYIGSSNENGVVTAKGTDTIRIGSFNDNPKEFAAMEKFAEIYQIEGKNTVVVDHECRKARWEKLVYNVSFNPLTAIVNMDVNRCQIHGANETLIRPAMRELIAIAKSDGYDIPEKTMEFFIHIGDGFFYCPSMCIDTRKKQLMEIEVILGNPLKVAEKNGVDAPILNTFYNLLKLKQMQLKEDKGLVKIDKEDYVGNNSDEYPSIFIEKNNLK
ncbi:uncharacterized protein KQ657_001552 [Scheffersomyces spartinae]|uniref:2-dehydropantoate 2-reductase n=1 Tax=Scheffersomyces spartinae TaxID=45513 RepID=A0A9P7V7M6_9ASCO|nr:uncharacterized protein KQ657_001552 [Scheffersomyces spartinae]KAG7192769.1 hypothetical protein KQ657_001552 [Scheffersomyces spartinae]